MTLEQLRVIDYGFNDVDDPSSWQPGEPWDIDEWIWVTVGDEFGGSDFQIRICTPSSIVRVTDKRGVFLIDEFTCVEDLLDALNRFIAKVQKDPTRNPYHVLATHWKWEYGPANKKYL